ncbi:MAG: hypothetical protein IJB74_03600 [Clostridia bacterium]|nr:hypothetical protein [Clostridia bacterium]
MKLRKSTFGGFNKQDVIAYIEKVKNDAYEEKNRLQKQVKDLTDKISELEAQVSVFDEEKDKLVKRIGELSVSSEGKNETVEEINEATNHLKNVADELCQSLRDFMQRISENCCTVVIEDGESEPEEEFDGEKFIAELEAEIYAKLGVEESDKEKESSEEYVDAEVTAQETLFEEEKDINQEKVSSILSSVSAFSFGEEVKTEKEESIENDSTVTDILDSLSFLK